MIQDKNDQDEDILIKSNKLKVKAFFENDIPVHLLKLDREWMNGIIVEVRDDFFFINERKKGKRMVFFHELYHIEEMIKEDVE